LGSVSEGAILAADTEVAEQTQPVVAAVQQHLTEQEAVVHFDENCT
jgi:hypothetical protein